MASLGGGVDEELDGALAKDLDHDVVDGVAAVEAVEVALRHVVELAVHRLELLVAELLDQPAAVLDERTEVGVTVLRLESAQVLPEFLDEVAAGTRGRHLGLRVRANESAPQAGQVRPQKTRPRPIIRRCIESLRLASVAICGRIEPSTVPLQLVFA